MGLFFSNTKLKIYSTDTMYLDKEKKICTLKDQSFIKCVPTIVFSFNEVQSFEILQDNRTVYKTKVDSGISRAIIGGALFGGVGAIIGASTSSSTTYSSNNAVYYLLITLTNGQEIKRRCENEKCARALYDALNQL